MLIWGKIDEERNFGYHIRILWSYGLIDLTMQNRKLGENYIFSKDSKVIIYFCLTWVNSVKVGSNTVVKE